MIILRREARSGVGDEVHLGDSVLVLDELLLVERIEVLGETLSAHGLHFRLTGLGSMGHLEALILFLISS